MLPRETELIDLDDIEDFDLPPRSRLFNLTPIGLGTDRVESLISYLVRLARAHAVNPRRLVERELAQANPAIGKLRTAFFRRDSATANGMGRYAELFVDTLTSLTTQPGLRRLTVLPWKDVFPHNGQGLLARHPQWCPTCLAEQARVGGESVFPLVWYFELYKVCHFHGLSMEHLCPICSKAQPFVPRWPLLSHCHHCQAPLAQGIARTSRDKQATWLAQMIGDMVKRQSAEPFAPTIHQFRQFVLAAVTETTGGNRAAFCRMLGFDNHGLRGWLNRGERPSFSQLLALAQGLGVMPADIFLEGPAVVKPAETTFCPGKALRRNKCPRPTPDERQKLSAALMANAAGDNPRPVSMIATKLGVSARCLRYWFPDLCARIAQRHRTHLKGQAAARHAAQCERIQTVVRQAAEKGGLPSRRRIGRALQAEQITLIRRDCYESYVRAARKDKLAQA